MVKVALPKKDPSSVKSKSNEPALVLLSGAVMLTVGVAPDLKILKSPVIPMIPLKPVATKSSYSRLPRLKSKALRLVLSVPSSIKISSLRVSVGVSLIGIISIITTMESVSTPSDKVMVTVVWSKKSGVGVNPNE